MKKRSTGLILAIIMLVATGLRSHAAIFNLDSIAAMGRFPRFCVDTYRWGDKFFNGYDTTYVSPTGYKFNIKAKADSWLEYNSFRFDDNRFQMDMYSYPSTSIGLWATYMAVSAGYDVNVSKLLGLTPSSRKRFNFQFNCMLFAADLYLQTSNSNLHINRFGPIDDLKKVDILFDGARSSSWGLDTYYFFNHKHYSQSAAFFYSRIQRKSSGSLYAGFSISSQNTTFDFSKMPVYILEEIPASWPDNTYHSHFHNYALKFGYGYNFVLSQRCIIGVSLTPSLGIRYGYTNDPAEHHTSFYGFNRAKASFIYNNGAWFAGVVGQADTNMFTDRNHTIFTNIFSLEASVGYRFNLW